MGCLVYYKNNMCKGLCKSCKHRKISTSTEPIRVSSSALYYETVKHVCCDAGRYSDEKDAEGAIINCAEEYKPISNKTANRIH